MKGTDTVSKRKNTKKYHKICLTLLRIDAEKSLKQPYVWYFQINNDLDIKKPLIKVYLFTLPLLYQ